jgi:hypothetical protein
MSGKEVEIIGILSSSQGKIAVVSALLAGIGYSVLTSITPEELVNSSYLGVFFVISSTSVVAGNIFVAIICSMSEQEGEVAHAMSILRDNRQFDLQLEKWWQKFSPLRTRSVWIFYFSVPLLFLAVALLSLIKWPKPFSYLIASLFLIFGIITTQNIFWLSSIFRSDVLLIETFQEVKFNTKLKRVLSSRDSSRYNIRSSVVGNDEKSPPPTPRQKLQFKTQTSFDFHETVTATETETPPELDSSNYSSEETEAGRCGEREVAGAEEQMISSRNSTKSSSSFLNGRTEIKEPLKGGHHSVFDVLAVEDDDEEPAEEIEVNQQQVTESVAPQIPPSTTLSKRKKSKKKR